MNAAEQALLAIPREINLSNDVPHDGYCPVCFAGDDEACINTRTEEVVPTHKRRHPSPPKAERWQKHPALFTHLETDESLRTTTPAISPPGAVVHWGVTACGMTLTTTSLAKQIKNATCPGCKTALETLTGGSDA